MVKPKPYLHKTEQAFTVKCLLQILANDIWVIAVNLGQKDKGWNVCITTQPLLSIVGNKTRGGCNSTHSQLSVLVRKTRVGVSAAAQAHSCRCCAKWHDFECLRTAQIHGFES